MPSEMNSRFDERDLLMKFRPVDDIFHLEAVTVAVDGDTGTISLCEGASAVQQAATGKLPHVEAVVAFAR